MIKVNPARNARGSARTIIFKILFVGGAVFFGYQAYEANSEKSWTQTKATIDSVKIYSWYKRRSGMRYAPQVFYHFVVKDKSIESETKLTAFESEERAKSEALNYPSGKMLTIFYNPSDPEKTTTTPGSAVTSNGGAAAACLLALGLMQLMETVFQRRYITRPKHSHPFNVGGP